MGSLYLPRDRRGVCGGDAMKEGWRIQMRMSSSMMDSGLVVVVFIITSLIILTFSFLLLVDYEWCHVLHKNNTENPLCTKNNNRDKLLLTSLADQLDKNRGKLRRTGGTYAKQDIKKD